MRAQQKHSFFIFTGFCLLLISFITSPIVNTARAATDNEPPVHFTADRLDHDDSAQTVIASGNVELIQGKRILHADQVNYDLQKDRVTAIGNVSLLDEGGRVHFADYLELSNQMKDGFVSSLTSYLTDGSRFTASTAERKDGNIMTMNDAKFTPCKVCAENPDKAPLWQIRAEDVTYDKEKGTVKYKNARLELLGIPFAYTPIFSHPDPRIKQQSGFLRPGGGWNSELGIFTDVSYYWGIDESQDATLHLKPTTDQGTLAQIQYRRNFDNGYIDLAPSVAMGSDRTEEDGRIEEDLTRGHIEGQGRFDINEKWRAGFNVMRASDKEYLRLYDISNEDVLENIAYAERFAGRNYTNINAQQFQDVRLGDRPEQPDVLPSISHSMLGAPEGLLGGRWSADFGLLGLKRSADGQDVNRASTEIGWRHDYIAPIGLQTVTTAKARLDYYHVRDIADSDLNPATEEKLNDTRFFPQIQSEVSYPFVKNAPLAQYTLEPKLAVTTGPERNNRSIPNEDSIDVQLDAANLFEMSRIPGEDLLDDGTRVTYGLGGGMFDYDGNRIEGFLGQSYRFDESAFLPENSGIQDGRSDYVGEISMDINTFLDFDYRFQLASDTLEPRRHELQAYGRHENLSWNTRYTYAKAIDGGDFDSTREQLQIGAAYRMTPNWQISASTLMDFGEEPGMRRASGGLLYSDECFTFGVQGVRRITDRSTGESETSLLMRIGFKYLGEIEAPQILLGTTENVER